jgi:hypothetical protein
LPFLRGVTLPRLKPYAVGYFENVFGRLCEQLCSGKAICGLYRSAACNRFFSKQAQALRYGQKKPEVETPEIFFDPNPK